MFAPKKLTACLNPYLTKELTKTACDSGIFIRDYIATSYKESPGARQETNSSPAELVFDIWY